jgi:hypothetical protein
MPRRGGTARMMRALDQPTFGIVGQVRRSFGVGYVGSQRFDHPTGPDKPTMPRPPSRV